MEAPMASNQLRIALALSLTLLLRFCRQPARAEDGVSDQKILFGQVAALSGPAKDLGEGMRQGILAAFNEANRHGGISGRTLELLSLDDGYEPEKTIGATKELIEQDKVFAIDRRGRHADIAHQPADRDGSESAVHRAVHRRPVSPQSVQPLCRQCPRLLQRGDRGLDRASDQGSRTDQDRDPLSGRRFRPCRP